MIFVVVPTVRPEQLELFLEAWKEQFECKRKTRSRMLYSTRL